MWASGSRGEVLRFGRGSRRCHVAGAGGDENVRVPSAAVAEDGDGEGLGCLRVYILDKD